ncbi:MAG: NAD(P)-dependent oxidoreductase [Rhodospirillaceae bacterium]|nr:NAD(P)-dependent oxidoreductase [Rhodospirillaceae bacterium]
MIARRNALSLSIAALASRTSTAQDLGGVLVFGASGGSGSEFIKHLPKDAEVTAFVRPTSKRERLAGLDVDYVTGNVLNEGDVAQAFKSGPFRTVFIGLQNRSNEPSPYVGAMLNITKYAKASGVEQILWIGQVGASAVPIEKADYPDINFELFDDTLKEIGEAEKILVESGVPYTVIRVGALMVERDRAPIAETGRGYLVDNLKIMGPITHGDLGRLAAECVGQARCMNKVFHATDDTLATPYKRWRCRRFATPATIDAC